MKVWWFATALWLGACSDGETVDLLLDLRTDLQPGIEFVEVRTERFARIPRSEEVAEGQDVRVRAIRGGDLVARGERIAEFSSLTPGEHVIRVRLLDRQGVAFLQRILLVTVRRTSVFTVLMTRDCRGIVCPQPGDDPSAIACLGGQCVRPECTPETPEFCPSRTCEVGVSCIAAAACAEPRCTGGGVCLRVGQNAACPPGQWCDPGVGCLPLPGSLIDGGLTADAGDPLLDAGDGGVDTGMDTGPPTLTATVQRVTLSDIAGTPANPRIAWTGTEVGLVYVKAGPNVYFSRRDLSGLPIGSEVLVSALEGRGNVPAIEWNPDASEFAITWVTDAINASNTYFARYSSTGTRIGADTLISSTGTGGSRFVRWNGSQYGITYRDQDASLIPRGYYVGVDATGNKIGSQVIVTGIGDCLCQVAPAWTGSRWGITWTKAGGARLRGFEVYFGLFDAAGAPDGPSVIPTDRPVEGSAQGASLAWTGERFGISWFDYDNGTGISRYFFTAVDTVGNKLFPDVVLASVTGFGIEPWIEWDGSRFAVLYRSLAGTGLVLQWISPDGVLVGDPVQVSVPEATGLDNPSMTWTGTSFVATWEEGGALMLGTITPD